VAPRDVITAVALLFSCVKKPGLDAAVMEADVIIACITPSFGSGIPPNDAPAPFPRVENESGPRRRVDEIPSYVPRWSPS
jgi:hypothetical protein